MPRQRKPRKAAQAVNVEVWSHWHLGYRALNWMKMGQNLMNQRLCPRDRAGRNQEPVPGLSGKSSMAVVPIPTCVTKAVALITAST